MSVSSPPARAHGPAPSVARSAAGDDRTVVEVLGSIVVLEVADAAWSTRIRLLLAPFVVDPATGAARGAPATSLTVSGHGGQAVLRAGPTELARGRWPAVEARLLVEVNAAAIAGCDGLAVHAGVVARGDRAICFPGESGLGKSTMTAACLGAGFDYVSDEALCLDRRGGAVVPYPRPLALSRASLGLLGYPGGVGRELGGADGRDADGPRADDLGPDPLGATASAEREVVVTASALGARTVAPDRRLRLAHVVELRRGASEVHLEPLHRSHAVTDLLALSFNHYKEPDASVALVAGLARDVRVWRLHHDDPVEAAALLARELG